MFPVDPKSDNERERTVAHRSVFVTACVAIMWVLGLALAQLSHTALAPDTVASAIDDYR